MPETWCLLHYSDIWSTLSIVKKQKPLDSEERMLFQCFQTNIGLTLVVRIILHNLWLFVLSFTFIRASLDWLWEWCSFLLRSSLNSTDVWSVVLPPRRGRHDHPLVFRGLLSLLMRLSLPVSLLTVWWFYFNLSVSFVTLNMRSVIVRGT